MGIFDSLKGKKVQKKENAEDLLKKVFEGTKNISVDMNMVEKLARDFPNNQLYHNVKNPDDFQARNHSLHYSMIRKYDKSIASATKGLSINPESAYLFYMRGRSKGDIGLFEEGLEDLNKALIIEPNYDDAFVERGYIKQKMGDKKGAEDDYKSAKKINPNITLPL